MRTKEAGLWILFLVLCFGAGFLKGYFPPEMWPQIAGGSQEVEILVHDVQLFPDSIKTQLERKLNIQIHLTVVEDREAFAVRTITSPGYHVALVPDHWIPPAVSAHQMSNLNPVRDLRNQRVATDFLSDNAERIYRFPIFWLSTLLMRNSEKEIQQYFLLKDWEYISHKILALDIPTQIVSPWPFLKPLPLDSEQASVFEVSHLTPENLTANLQVYKPEMRFLYIWSLTAPRHSPSRKMTLRLIRELAEPEIQKEFITQLPLASTFVALDQKSLPRNQKSLFIRELDLASLQHPKELNLEQLSEVRGQF